MSENQLQFPFGKKSENQENDLKKSKAPTSQDNQINPDVQSRIRSTRMNQATKAGDLLKVIEEMYGLRDEEVDPKKPR